MTKQNKLPHGSLIKIMHDYNSKFVDQTKLTVTYNIANKKFLAITRAFSNRWHPCDSKQTYLDTFSITEWNKLEKDEQEFHTLRNCQICKQKYLQISKSFPGQKLKIDVPIIKFSQQDFSSPVTFSTALLKEANTISKSTFNVPITKLITETPEYKLINRPTKSEEKRVRRKILHEVKENVQDEMNDSSDSLVLQNRISWSTFDKIRKQEGLTRKRKNESETSSFPKQRKHGHNHLEFLIDTDQLLDEARQWGDGKIVNWTALGTKYGLTSSNRGQVIKEYLANYNVPFALVPQRENRAPRRAKKKLPGSGGRVSFPMYQPVKKQKEKLASKITNGEILLGREIVPTYYETFSVNHQINSITETSNKVYAREIPIMEIRKKLLNKHEQLGIIRNCPDTYFTSLTREECCAKTSGA